MLDPQLFDDMPQHSESSELGAAKLEEVYRQCGDTIIQETIRTMEKSVCPGCLLEKYDDLYRVLNESTFDDTPVTTLLLELNCPTIKIEGMGSLLQKTAFVRTRLSEGSLQQAYQELVSVYPDRVSLHFLAIEFTTQYIVLEDVEFGRFSIFLTADNIRQVFTGQPLEINISPLEKNDAIEDYCHPHVSSSGIVCLGDQIDIITASILSLDLVTFFESMENILGTYNPESPFPDASIWIWKNGTDCPDCGESIECTEDSTDCVECGKVTCCDCSCRCLQCDADGCADCFGPMGTCDNCGFLACALCVGEWQNCYECGEARCCSSTCERGLLTECERCNHQLCSNCTRQCEVCERILCEPCLDDSTCDRCQEDGEEEEASND